MDITFCTGTGCTLKEKCRRFYLGRVSNRLWHLNQSWMDPPLGNPPRGECAYFDPTPKIWRKKTRTEKQTQGGWDE